jgi:hypothetical protein
MPLPDKFTVAGSPEQVALMLPILEAMYLGFKESQVSGGGTNRPPISPDFQDWLQVTLHWRGIVASTGKNHTVEKSFRLKGIDPKTVSLAYLKELGQRIIAKFNGLNFTTGHCKVKYTKWKDGIWTWGYFDTKETGYRIVEAMGDIIAKPIDKALVRYEYVLEPTEAFDETPDKITVAGKLVRPRAVAPVANMKFYGATILFPWIGHTEQLCNISGYVIKNLSFLDAYDD